MKTKKAKYKVGDRVVVMRFGQLRGRTGTIDEVNRSEKCRSLDLLHVDIGTLRVPCLPDQVELLSTEEKLSAEKS